MKTCELIGDEVCGKRKSGEKSILAALSFVDALDKLTKPAKELL